MGLTEVFTILFALLCYSFKHENTGGGVGTAYYTIYTRVQTFVLVHGASCYFRHPHLKTRTKHVLLFSVQGSLPPDYDYHICNYQEVGDGKYEAEFRIDIGNEDVAKLWLEQYQQLTNVTFRVEATKPRNGWVNLFIVFYRCQHKTLPRSRTANQKLPSKNKNCPAKLAMTIIRVPGETEQVRNFT